MTKTLSKIIATLLLLYLLAWVAAGSYFAYVASDKARVARYLQPIFGGSDVSIGSLSFQFVDHQLQLNVGNLQVRSQNEQVTQLAIKNFNAVINPWSFLWLWPEVEGLAIEQPYIEIDVRDSSKITVAGIPIKKSKASVDSKRRVVRWILDQKNTAIHSGEVVWRRALGPNQRYKDFSFIYERDGEVRSVDSAVVSPKGALAVRIESRGDIVEQADWDATLEVLGGGMRPLLNRDDFKVTVIDGAGVARLEALDVERISDLLLLIGLGSDVDWFLDANVTGRLRDVEFEFSGPLFSLKHWQISAVAEDIGIRPVKRTISLPKVSGLNGTLNADKAQGRLTFEASQARFDWEQWFDQPFAIDQADGVIEWQYLEDRRVKVSLHNGRLKDSVVEIENLQLSAIIGKARSEIDTVADLFTVESLRDLTFEQGSLIDPSARSEDIRKNITVQASANYRSSNVSALERYIPYHPKAVKLKNWWQNAFKQGEVHSGSVTFDGTLDRDDLMSGRSELSADAQFANVILDYGYQRQWPLLTAESGKLTLADGVLEIETENAVLGKDLVRDSQVEIVDILKLSRTLLVTGSTSTDFATASQLILQGPLFEPDKRPKTMPINPLGGDVDIFVDLVLPLADVNQVELEGYADVRNAAFELTGGVPLSGINTRVTFTEQSAESDWMNVQFLGGTSTARLRTLEAGKPPKLIVEAKGELEAASLSPWVGEHLASLIEGKTTWAGEVLFDTPRVQVSGYSDLVGISINAPQPLRKQSPTKRRLNLDMQFGSRSDPQNLDLKLGGSARVQMRQNNSARGSFFDAMLVTVGNTSGVNNRPGVHFDIDTQQIDLDEWLDTIIALAEFEPKTSVNDTTFLDAMRSVRIRSDNPRLLGRQFGELEMTATSSDGAYWFGGIEGERINGNLQMEPRANVSQFRFDLENLYLDVEPNQVEALAPIDATLDVETYPAIDITIQDFKIEEMPLGSVVFRAAPFENVWKVLEANVSHQGVVTNVTGEWRNSAELGSISMFEYQTDIQAAGQALDSMDFAGLLKSGKGYAKGRLEWRGAPHEFDYSRLEGDFDIRISDGELVQVEPGSGRLFGLLNFNAILRRATLDFSDVVASGLQFDQMQYTGIIAEGRAFMNEAYLFSPAVFVRMQGAVDLDKELIDMEFNVAPELGGNLTLLSALANPTAGAVVFLLQNLFKDEMRSTSLVSYRAKGTWADFEFEELNADGDVIDALPPLRNDAREAAPTSAQDAHSADEQPAANSSDYDDAS